MTQIALSPKEVDKRTRRELRTSLQHIIATLPRMHGIRCSVDCLRSPGMDVTPIGSSWRVYADTGERSVVIKIDYEVARRHPAAKRKRRGREIAGALQAPKKKPGRQT